MLSILSQQRNANYTEIPSHLSQTASEKENTGKDAEKSDLLERC